MESSQMPVITGLLIAVAISAILWKFAELKERKKSRLTITELHKQIAELEAQLSELKNK